VEEPTEETNGTCYPLFSCFSIIFGVKKCLITFSGNQSGPSNFCNYEPILMKYSGILSDIWDDTVLINRNVMCYYSTYYHLKAVPTN